MSILMGWLAEHLLPRKTPAKRYLHLGLHDASGASDLARSALYHLWASLDSLTIHILGTEEQSARMSNHTDTPYVDFICSSDLVTLFSIHND